jgi:hypothetical protein
MRYVVVDLQGNQRAQSDSNAELISELREVVRDDPEALRALDILEYGDDGTGRHIGRADQVLARASRRPGALLVDFVHPGAAAHVEMSDTSFSEFRNMVDAVTRVGAGAAS